MASSVASSVTRAIIQLEYVGLHWFLLLVITSARVGELFQQTLFNLRSLQDITGRELGCWQ